MGGNTLPRLQEAEGQAELILAEISKIKALSLLYYIEYTENRISWVFRLGLCLVLEEITRGQQ